MTLTFDYAPFLKAAATVGAMLLALWCVVRLIENWLEMD